MPACPDFVFDVHTHFSIEETAISEDADKLGYVVENHFTLADCTHSLRHGLSGHSRV